MSESNIIAEATVTLPEGATVQVARCSGTGKIKTPYTRLSAWRDGKSIEMRVDNVNPNNLLAYLDLVLRDIDRRRSLMTEKPAMVLYDKPRDMREFAELMAYNDMFTFDVALEVEPEPKKKRKRKKKNESNITTDQELQGANGKAS